MGKPIKIVIVNESFSNPIFYRRWELFAQKYKDVDLTLLTPSKEVRKITPDSFGKEVVNIGQTIEKDNFHIKLYTQKLLGSLGYLSPDFKTLLVEIKPDIVYNIGAHNQPSLYQLIYLTKKYLPDTKIMSFSMRGPNYDIIHFKEKCSPISRYLKRRLFYYYYAKIGLNYFNKNCDAVFCHYPDAMNCFIKEGYNGPIYMQTQVGVNPELFHEDKHAREEIRSKYGVDDNTFLFGSATRFTKEKGLDVIIKALPKEGNYKFLMMGAGTDENTQWVKGMIEEYELTDKIILPGFIQLQEMPKYWNAIDCMVHVPTTTFSWVETFSIALVQAMITGKPVIGNDSGSVPYQIGPEGIIVKEGDILSLNEKMKWILNNQDKVLEIGEKMFKRANNCFSILHLNDLFYKTIKEDIMTDSYDKQKSDMAHFRTEQ